MMNSQLTSNVILASIVAALAMFTYSYVNVRKARIADLRQRKRGYAQGVPLEDTPSITMDSMFNDERYA